jgi:hypothetical protein
MKIGTVISWLRTHLLIVGCLFLGAILIVVIQMRMSELDQLRQKVDESQKKVDKIHANTRASATLSEDLKKLDDYGASISKSLIVPSTKAANLAYFYALGTKSDVVLSKVEQMPVVMPAATKAAPTKPYATIRFEVVVEGGIANVIRFIAAVRGDHPLLRVDRLSISPSASLTGTGSSVAASLTFTFLAVAEETK